MPTKGLRGILALLEAPAPGFWCKSATSGQLIRVEVEHRLNNPPADEDLARLRELSGDSFDALFPFYSRWDGGRLFKEPMQDEPLFEFYPIGRMEPEHHGLRSWMEMVEDEIDASEIQAVLDMVVIGQPPSSPDQFGVKPSGEDAGKVLQFSHDELALEVRAQSVEAFLRHISTDPVKLSYDLGCVGRFRGKVQAIPYYYSDNIHEVDAPPPLPEWW